MHEALTLENVNAVGANHSFQLMELSHVSAVLLSPQTMLAGNDLQLRCLAQGLCCAAEQHLFLYKQSNRTNCLLRKSDMSVGEVM